MSKNIIIGIIIILFAGGLLYVLMSNSKSPGKIAVNNSPATVSDSGNSASPTLTVSPPVSPTTSTENESPLKTITVKGGKFYFKPNEIRVKKGDTVKIIFNNIDGMHDWVLDEFNVRTKIIQSGESDAVQFVADKTGTFEYYCSVDGHRAMGMKGNLIVE